MFCYYGDALRLLVYPHELSIGGSQINAIDLAAGAARAGHDVAVYGIPGPLVGYIEKQGLPFLPAHRLKYRPAPSRIAQLAHIAARERIDLIHAFEWPPCLDAYLGAGLLGGVRVLCTVLGMELMPAVPASLPLIVGTAELGAHARISRTGKVWVLEPPIDTVRDQPGVDGQAFRLACHVAADELLIVSVSRLALDLKLDALVRAIDAVALLATRYPVKLILVGDGAARRALELRADTINKRFGRRVVALHGAVLDPRAAYAAADLVLGMGSSALRAMAIGRPVIVQGEKGFSEIFRPATLDMFSNQGFYGLLDADTDPRPLASQIETLLRDPVMRDTLGRYGRKVVEERFSLKRAVGIQLSIYEEVLRLPPVRSVRDALHSAGRALGMEIENHDPRIKRRRERRDATMLRTAGCGDWPPTEVA